jgi:hypothetical protein
MMMSNQLWLSVDTEKLCERACELLGETAKWAPTWKEVYEAINAKRGYTDGELERAAAEILGMDEKAAKGFVVFQVIEGEVCLEDLESAGCVDLSSEEDAHNIPYVEAFRRWAQHFA